MPDLKSIRHYVERRSSELSWVMAGQGMSFFGGVAGVVILTRYLAPTAYGELGLGMTLAGLIFTVLYNPLQNALVRFYSVFRDRDSLPNYYQLFRRLFLVASLGVLAVAVLAAAIGHWLWQPKWDAVLLSAALFGVANGYFFFYIGLQNALRLRKDVALHMGFEPWLRVACALIGVSLFGKIGAVAIGGYCVAECCLVASLRHAGLRKSVIAENWKRSHTTVVRRPELREILAYVFPYSGLALATTVSLYGDRWVLEGTLGAQELGIYTALNQLASAPGGLVSGIVNAFMVPIIFERAGDMTNPEKIRSSLKLTFGTIALSALVFLPCLLLFYFWGEALLRILTSTVYAARHSVLWILALGTLLYQIGINLSMFGQIYRRNQSYVLPWTLNAFATIGFSWWWGRAYGLLGFACALLASNGLFASVTGVITWRLIAANRLAVAASSSGSL